MSVSGKSFHGLAANNVTDGFVITQVSNIAIVYTVDAHRPIAGEVVVSELSFKGKNKAYEILQL